MPVAAWVRWAVVGLGLSLACGLVAPRVAAAAEAPTIYHKYRSFRIPFVIDEAERAKLREVQLWLSEDSGFTWHPVGRTTPDRPAFTYRAQRDGEFWC